MVVGFRKHPHVWWEENPCIVHVGRKASQVQIAKGWKRQKTADDHLKTAVFQEMYSKIVADIEYRILRKSIEVVFISILLISTSA